MSKKIVMLIVLNPYKGQKKGYKNKNKRFTDNNNSKPESIAITNAFLYILSAIYN